MTVSPARTLSTEVINGLRHRLRTLLNHVLGYSEMLSEVVDPNAPDGAGPRLQAITGCARQILQMVQTHLPLDRDVREADLSQLRAAMLEPVHIMIREVGQVTQCVSGSQLKDLLRINTAAGELLSFTEGRLTVTAGDQHGTLLEPRKASGISGRVLLVDDNEVNRDVLARQLQRQNHVVETAESGDTAIAKMNSGAFDLVLLDMVMPGMNGLEVLKLIKADPNLANTPVIMISALDQLDRVAYCIEAGADDCLTKPVEPALLSARVCASLERKKLRDQEREREKELEGALEKLQQSNEDLQQFAHAVSHDLQEPLRTMASYAQLLQRRYGNQLDADADKFLDLITGSAVRMRQFILDLLDFSQLRTAEQPSMAQVVDAKAALSEALSNLGSAVEEAGATVTAGDLPTLTGSTGEYVRLFQNLISNAIKYKQPGVPPSIEITAKLVGDESVISVADNGVGIEGKYLEQVFAPFKRLHGAEIPGTGVGLSVCRRVVERHGGRIWVESAGRGQGATFLFTAPFAH